ncbi:MAG: polyprenol phosphomannose-dependent alpha 1,6 mannosyltransferase MptB [Pseudonocardiales bacterium]
MRIPASPTRLRLAGLGGSLLLSGAAVGAGVLPRPDPLRDAVVLSALRDGPGRVACIAVAVAGMALLVTAWLLLGRGLGTVDARWLCATAALWALPMTVVPPILSRDVYGYAVAGQMLQGGIDPYSHGAADLASSWVPSTSTSWLHVPFAYGPLFLLLARLVVGASGDSLLVAVSGMRVLAVAGTALLAWALPRAARACGTDERHALWLGLVNPLVLAHFVGGAHADALMVGLMVAGLALAAGRWPATGALVCTLAVAVKATASLALPFVALLWVQRLQRRQRPLPFAITATLVVAGATFAAVTAVSGVGYGWVRTVDTVGLSRQWTSLPTGLGLVLGGSSTALALTRGIAFAAIAAVAVAVWVRAARRGGTRPAVEGCGWVLLAVVALGPAVHPWYVTWPVAVLAAAGITARPRTAVVATCTALCFLVLPDGYNLARATQPVGLVIDVLVALGLAALGVRALLRSRASEEVPV